MANTMQVITLYLYYCAGFHGGCRSILFVRKNKLLASMSSFIRKKTDISDGRLQGEFKK